MSVLRESQILIKAASDKKDSNTEKKSAASESKSASKKSDAAKSDN